MNSFFKLPKCGNWSAVISKIVINIFKKIFLKMSLLSSQSYIMICINKVVSVIWIYTSTDET